MRAHYLPPDTLGPPQPPPARPRIREQSVILRASLMILRATHTHLYPGHRGTVAGLAQRADWRVGGSAVVEFSDGSATTARITPSNGDWLLRTDPYRTAAGTEIAERRWRVELKQHEDHVEFRILRRNAAGDSNDRGR